MVIINPMNGFVKMAKAFDTHASSNEFDQFIKEEIPDGDIIVAACKDECIGHLSINAKFWFSNMGSHEIWKLGYRKGFVFIGKSGSYTGANEKRGFWANEHVSVSQIFQLNQESYLEDEDMESNQEASTYENACRIIQAAWKYNDIMNKDDKMKDNDVAESLKMLDFGSNTKTGGTHFQDDRIDNGDEAKTQYGYVDLEVDKEELEHEQKRQCCAASEKGEKEVVGLKLPLTIQKRPNLEKASTSEYSIAKAPEGSNWLKSPSLNIKTAL